MHDEHTRIDPAGPAAQWRPSRLAVALAGAGGFLAGVLLVAALGGTPTTTVNRTTTVAVTTAVTVTTPAATDPNIVTVPTLIGVRLDTATQQVSDLGLDSRVVGGGLFGVVDEANWVVVDQDPKQGTRLQRGGVVTLRIDRN